MNFSMQHKRDVRQTLGASLVVLFHVAAVTALVWGVGSRMAGKAPGPTVLRPVIDEPIVDPIPQPVKVDDHLPQPNTVTIVPPIMPTQDVNVDSADTITAVPGVSTKPFEEGLPVAVSIAPTASAPAGVAGRAGMVCSQMPQPEMPATNYVGEADFLIRGTVHGGRVVAVEFVKAALHTGTDRKALNAFQAAISNTLRAQWRCDAGDHRFEQMYTFKIN